MTYGEPAANRAFGEDSPEKCPVDRCTVARRDVLLDYRLREAQTELRRAEDELAVWRGLSAELTALRALRDIVREECWKQYPDTVRLDRAVRLAAPVGTDHMEETS